MVSFFGDYDTTETVVIPFNTFSSDDPSASVTATNLVAGDVEIHKDGGTTQRSSDAGVTVSIDFDGVTGNHLVSIDLSDNTDAGFYAAGSRYQVRVEGITVDAGTVNAWIGAFSIGCTLRPATDGRTVVVDADGLIDANTVKVGPSGSGTAQTANDMSGDVDDILTDTGTTIPGTITTIDNEIAVIDGNVDDILADTNELQTDDVPTLIGALNDPTAAAISDAVWDEAQADHTSAGSFGLVASEIATIDGIVDDILTDTGTTLQAELDGIQADTEDIQTQIGTAGAGLTAVPWNASWDAEVQSECADALTAYDPPTRTELTSDKAEIITEVNANETKIDTIDGNVDSILTDTGTTLPASIAALNDLSAADVNAEVVDALDTDTYAEPAQGAPGATVSLSDKISYIYKAWRNKKEQTAAVTSYYNDAGDTVDQKQTVSDDGTTATKGEVVSGP